MMASPSSPEKEGWSSTSPEAAEGFGSLCATFNLSLGFASHLYEVRSGFRGISFTSTVNTDSHYSLTEHSIVFGGHMMRGRGGHRGEEQSEECIHQMQHRDITLKDNHGRNQDIKAVLVAKKAPGMLPGTVFVPLGRDGRHQPSSWWSSWWRLDSALS
jgi:hypothetical protein